MSFAVSNAILCAFQSGFYPHSQSLGENLFELVLSDTCAHSSRGTDAACDHLLQLVDICSTAPFLVLDDVNLLVHLRLLNKLTVGTHADGAVGLCKLVADQSCCVQTCKSDELPAVTERGQATNVSLLLIARHSCLPVEGWRKVVSKPSKVT